MFSGEDTAFILCVLLFVVEVFVRSCGAAAGTRTRVLRLHRPTC